MNDVLPLFSFIRKIHLYVRTSNANLKHFPPNGIKKMVTQHTKRPGVKFCVSDIRQKSRTALENRANSGLNPLITESHGGQNGMRAGTA